jgi:hypothetical protein
MFQNVERYVDFITTNKLTQAQFLFLYLIYRKKLDAIIKYKEAVPTEDGSMIGKPSIEDLIKRGFVLKVDEGISADSFMITEKFHKLFLKNIHVAAQEFWDKYPGFVRIQGVATPLTNMDKYAFANIYGERIDYSVDEHLEVMKDLEFGVQQSLVRTSIEKFVRSEAWKKLREIRLNQRTVQEVDALAGDF